MSGQHEHKYSYLVEILTDLQTVWFLTNVINVAIIIWMTIYLYTFYSEVCSVVATSLTFITNQTVCKSVEN